MGHGFTLSHTQNNQHIFITWRNTLQSRITIFPRLFTINNYFLRVNNGPSFCASRTRVVGRMYHHNAPAWLKNTRQITADRRTKKGMPLGAISYSYAKILPAIGIGGNVIKTAAKARVPECCRGLFERHNGGWEVESARVVKMRVSCMLQTLPMHQVDRTVSAHKILYSWWKLARSACINLTAVQHDAQQKA